MMHLVAVKCNFLVILEILYLLHGDQARADASVYSTTAVGACAYQLPCICPLPQPHLGFDITMNVPLLSPSGSWLELAS